MRSNEEFAQHIDAVLPTHFVGKDGIDEFFAACKQYNFAAAAIAPCWIEYFSKKLVNEGISTSVVGAIGYPDGYTTTAIKVFAAQDALKSGAKEVDMMMNLGWMLNGRYADVEEDIRQVVKACNGQPLKVIIETCILTDEQKREAVRICKRAGATYVKTSSGTRANGGATVEDVKLILKEAGDSILLKASGGIRTRKYAEELLDLGAARLGISFPQRLMKGEELKDEENIY